MANNDTILPAAPASPNANLPSPAQIANPPFGPVPQMDPGMTFRTLGSSGLRQFGGYVREEFLPQLQGRQAQTVYREMSDNSAIVGGMVFAINATMRKVEWRVVPADDTPAAEEAAEFADSLRDDMGDVTWEETISEALSMVTYGFAPLEINYKRRMGRDPGMDPRRPGKRLPKSKFDDGKIGWESLPIRGQDTVIKWFFDENGIAEGLTQQPWVGPLLDIPLEKVLLFRPTQHKNNPEGRSVIRNCYRSYYMVKRLEEQEAILAERMNGIPVISVPAALMEAARGTGPDAAAALAAINTFKNMAINLRVDEQMGLLLPSDVFMSGDGSPSSIRQYSLELVAPGGAKGSGGAGGTNEIINRHNSLMLMSVLADFLTLGHGKTGTQALAVSKTDMFFQAVEGYLNSTGAVFNRSGLERLWELNGMDPDLMPELQPDLAQRVDLDVLSNYVLRLSQSGMAIFPNTDLEAALLDAAGLPDVSETSAGDLLAEGASTPPVAIVGPHAAVAQAEMMPKPSPAEIAAATAAGRPEQGSPRSNFEKMMMGSLARRVIQKQGSRTNIITDRKAQALRKRLPTPSQLALF